MTPMQSIEISDTFSNLQAGAIVSPNSNDAFTNKLNVPILVEEIRFAWNADTSFDTGGATAASNQGDTLRAEIYYGREPLTASFVPVNLLCRNRNPEVNAPSIESLLTTHVNPPETSLVWRLPTPVYLEPLCRLQIQLQYQNDFVPFANFTFTHPPATIPTVRVSLVARFADRSVSSNENIDLPYVAKYLAPVFGLGLNNPVSNESGAKPATTVQSGPTDLYNPFMLPLSIDHMLAEISMVGSNQAGSIIIPTDGFTQQIGASYGMPQRHITMRMTTSDNKYIVRDYTPVGNIVSMTDRSWPMHCILPPQGYYLADIIEQFPIYQGGAGNSLPPFMARLGLSLVGSRRVRLGHVSGGAGG